MNKTLFYLTVFSAIIISSCINEYTTTENYVIPCHYQGWVNIIYGVSNGKKVSISDTLNTYFLLGNLTRYYVSNSLKSGSYDSHYFESCNGKLRRISGPTEVNSRITRGYTTKTKIGIKWHDVHAFYISHNVLPITLPDNYIPQNPIDTIKYTEIKD